MEKKSRRVSRTPMATRLEIINLYKHGYSCNSISKMLLISSTNAQKWINRYLSLGSLGLDNPLPGPFTIKFKEKVIRYLFKTSLSCEAVGLKYNLGEITVNSWKRIVESEGYDGLNPKIAKIKRPRKMANSKDKLSKNKVQQLEEEVLYLRAENDYLKKLRVLVEERVSRESKKSSKSSKN